MSRTLPPLEMFRFFEAAARHANFTRAAEELHVTHGAVSQRIKRLEEHLGTPLFRRSAGRMLLTEDGSRLLERVRAAIGEIAEGVEAIRPGSRQQILTISTVPCFAAYWLLPRLADFNKRHPEIQVNIRATLARTDFAGDDIDMAVRAGAGTWEGLTSIKLQDEQLVPVCSPVFQEGRLPRVPVDLLNVPLLHDDRQPWSIWFEAIGLEYRDVGGGARYTDQNLLIPAAVAGLGVALARASLVQADLESGRLVRLFSRSVPARSSYFIVYPKGSQSRRKVQVFQQWLLEQVRTAEREGAIGTRMGQAVTNPIPQQIRRRRVASA
jgi:LysR family glycine cleavage system transcriptional activator